MKSLSVVMMVTATRRADSPTASLMFFRMLAVVMFTLDLLFAAASGEWAGVEFWVLVLIAEYAATIRTILPRSLSHSRAAEASQRI
jgi:hypothetical protein